MATSAQRANARYERIWETAAALARCWVMVTAPGDQVFIGPFVDAASAEAWIVAHDAEGHGFDYRTLTSAEHAANVAEYGPLRTYTAEEYAA